MKTLCIICILFFFVLAPHVVSAIVPEHAYGIDILEPGNPGGWYGTSLKTWDEEWMLEEGEEVYMDIWVDPDFCSSLICAGFWLTYDTTALSITSVELYDNTVLPGPWEPSYSVTIVPQPGIYLGACCNPAYPVQADSGGDIIIGRVKVRSEGAGDGAINISTIPGFDTLVCDSIILDSMVSPTSVTIHERECTTNADCNDGLWCTATDICNNGICERTPRDCSAAGDHCNNGICNEILDRCVKQPKPDGTLCDDGIFCNGSDSCSGGSCSVHVGGPCAYCASYGCSCDVERGICVGCSGDDECDGICNPGATGPFCIDSDNCPDTPNGPSLGSCTSGPYSWFDIDVCLTHSECGSGGYCSMDQEDTVPPGGNDIGDACECEADFDCDRDVDGSDAAKFLIDFGRALFNGPCNSQDPCDGDFLCDGDVDGSDVVKFKEDFGRFAWSNPCAVCVTGAWCAY